MHNRKDLKFVNYYPIHLELTQVSLVPDQSKNHDRISELLISLHL